MDTIRLHHFNVSNGIWAVIGPDGLDLSPALFREMEDHFWHLLSRDGLDIPTALVRIVTNPKIYHIAQNANLMPTTADIYGRSLDLEQDPVYKKLIELFLRGAYRESRRS